jgi:hypothetical protein
MDGFVLNPSYCAPGSLDMPFRRGVAELLDLWEKCPRDQCRRAGACRSRAVACYDERRPEIIEIMIALLYDGYLHDEDGEEF